MAVALLDEFKNKWKRIAVFTKTNTHTHEFEKKVQGMINACNISGMPSIAHIISTVAKV